MGEAEVSAQLRTCAGARGWLVGDGCRDAPFPGLLCCKRRAPREEPQKDHMLPITGIPTTIARGMVGFRDLFCRKEGFEHVSRYVTGLIVSPNKTLQGIYDLQVWGHDTPSRRAMHEAVFEARWDSQALIQRHRTTVAPDHRGRGREVISVDWTLAHHERGPHIFGVALAYDDVQRRTARFQTVVTAVIANRQVIDGLEEIVHELEAEDQFPQANYAFDNGVLHLELTTYIESRGKHGVSEVECSRHIPWSGQWRRVESVATELKREHPESFRSILVQCRNGEKKSFWVFTKAVRLKRYGRKRLVIVHERSDLTAVPRFLVTDARHWESGRVIETWSYRWASEIFHEFGKQVTGLEAAQVRQEEAVNRH